MTRARAIAFALGPAAAVLVASSTAPALVGGSPSPTSQDAVVLVGAGNSGFCSGTLLAPNVVLTARRCVATTIDAAYTCGTGAGTETGFGQIGADRAPADLRIALSGGRDAPIAAVGTTITDDGAMVVCSHDIALVVLDKDIPNAVTTSVRRTAAAAGEAVTVVAFAQGDDDRPRLQRPGVQILALGPTNYDYGRDNGKPIHVAVQPGEMVTGESTCNGDQGAPLLDAQGLVVGVFSRGVTDSCHDAPQIDSDVVSHLDLIDMVLTAAGHPPVIPPGNGAGSSGGASPGPSMTGGGGGGGGGHGDDDGDDDDDDLGDDDGVPGRPRDGGTIQVGTVPGAGGDAGADAGDPGAADSPSKPLIALNCAVTAPGGDAPGTGLWLALAAGVALARRKRDQG